MGHQLESLLSSYFSQQEEMGIPMSVLISGSEKSREDSTMTNSSADLTAATEPVAEVSTPSDQVVQTATVSQAEKQSPEIQSPEIQPIEQTVIEESKPVVSMQSSRTQETVRAELADLYYRSRGCSACSLSQTRNSVVFGAGNAIADIMIVGEAPGFEEDQQGRPFVGAAGQLLTKMLQSINIDRDSDTFVCNILKCRPPGNRTPSTQECMTCLPILKRQIAIIKPKIILLLGKTAVASLLDMPESMKQLRGKEYSYHGIPTYVTYHPAALLRNSTLKRPAWEDLQQFQARYRELKDGE